MPFEISTRDSKAVAERGIVVPWIDPETKEIVVDEKGVQVSCTLLGGDAGVVAAKSDKNFNKFWDKLSKGQKDNDRAAESRETTITRLSVATTSWTPNWTYDGEILPCNEQNARKVYGDPRFRWLLDQLAVVIDDRARFFGESSTS
jgi:hypothetical protein